MPHLNIVRLVVADDEAAKQPLMQAAMTLAVPPSVEVIICSLEQADFSALASDPVPTLVLLRDVAAAVAARKLGLPDGTLNVGNVHAGLGRAQVTRSVFLTEEEREVLKNSGMTVTLQAVPSEAAIPL